MLPVTTERPTAADPEYRRARAKRAAKRRHSLDTYIASIVNRAPELTPEQCDQLAVLLRSSDSAGEAA